MPYARCPMPDARRNMLLRKAIFSVFTYFKIVRFFRAHLVKARLINCLASDICQVISYKSPRRILA